MSKQTAAKLNQRVDAPNARARAKPRTAAINHPRPPTNNDPTSTTAKYAGCLAVTPVCSASNVAWGIISMITPYVSDRRLTLTKTETPFAQARGSAGAKRRRSIKFLLPVGAGRPYRQKSLSQLHRKQSSVGGRDDCQT